MAVALDRTARMVVVLQGLAGGFVGALPAAAMVLFTENPHGNAWFRDVLLFGALGGVFVGTLGAVAGILHEDLRALRRQRSLFSNASDSHPEKAVPPAPARGSSDRHPVYVQPGEAESHPDFSVAPPPRG